MFLNVSFPNTLHIISQNCNSFLRKKKKSLKDDVEKSNNSDDFTEDVS